mmetsp:Transcript_22480/g.32815  ORF Transcript_22480/g.32815 Transcript_22480/m.32815 type:complete len:644 (-) Transcript_22480:212-2143(-)|eukprot:CAMPEP_0185034154 /NCGR_PEP_ID=MMETSP1103-20130426/23770_1 /TAXON_ID=36769 /ORGANISM="Paraphysomonas bandaiensis, Strain Caron Lab Isolate" /LENGTH=643 /DNA_ID=CAMNT_0027570695 /DNA_START=91 /DNA_END=2022 /DNA_ORIENTATION=+
MENYDDRGVCVHGPGYALREGEIESGHATEKEANDSDFSCITTQRLQDHNARQEDAQSSSSQESKTMMAYLLEGLGIGGDDDSALPEPELVPHDSLVMEADLLISNPYKNTSDKYGELKELENKAFALLDTPYEESRHSSLHLGEAQASPESNQLPPLPPNVSTPTNEKDTPAKLSPPAQSHVRQDDRNSLGGTLDSDMRGIRIPVGNRQRVQVEYMFAKGHTVNQHETLDSVYAQLKTACRAIDSTEQRTGSSDTEFPKIRRQCTRIGVTRLFGGGRIDGTKDFVRLNFPLNLDDIYSSHTTMESAVTIHKSALFLRRHSIWLAFYTERYPIRAVLMADMLLLFTPPSPDSPSLPDEKFVHEIVVPMRQLVEDWRVNNSKNSSYPPIPFEQDVFRGLVTMLGAKEKAEYNRLKKKLQVYLDFLQSLKRRNSHAILSMNLEFHSQNLKSEMTRMSSRMKSNLEAVEELVEDEDHADKYMDLMHLSVFRDDPSLYSLPSDERREAMQDGLGNYASRNLFEACMDKYIMDCEAILSQLDVLFKLIDNEESLFRLQLNYSQNEILILNTVLTILACAIGFGSYLTGAFGMNLDNTVTLQEKKHSFVVVLVSTFMAIVVTFSIPYVYFKVKGVLPRIAGKRGKLAEY